MATDEPTLMAEETTGDPVATEPAADKPDLAATGKEEKTDTKKTKAKKLAAPRKPRAPSSHPRYLEMIGEAINSLKERTGSSQYAITKFIEDKHKKNLPTNFKKLLLVQLRKHTASGKLTKVKNSYKLPSSSASTKTVATSKPAKPKAKAVVKPKAKAVVKAKAKPAPKPVLPAKRKAAAVVKPKPAVRISKPKPKTLGAKTGARPTKIVKISVKDAPGKKVTLANKHVVAPKKATAPAKLAKKVHSGKTAAKAPAKKAKK
ncbi:hypothetical protein HPP92_024333 [Vanilla planifolia]|uniref:H15 domain-containing protein n=1 Tax=Vanilla planifolia TaxID=51239 RepID=A0A835PMQ1_VANPL|nr:hypothetical protein HPP92_024333 [Vanilla planifolia]